MTSTKINTQSENQQSRHHLQSSNLENKNLATITPKSIRVNTNTMEREQSFNSPLEDMKPNGSSIFKKARKMQQFCREQ